MTEHGSVADQAETGAVASPVAVGKGKKPWRDRLSALAEWLRANLFLPTTGSVGWRQVVGAIGFLVVCAAVSLARTGGPGALNTIWIEDAKYALNDALNQPTLAAVTAPINGYYQSIPRVVAVVASALFPLKLVPGVMSAAAALQCAMYGLIAYTVSGSYFRSRWPRLLLAVPTCVIPLAYTQANNDLVTVQFCALYGSFWIFLWIPKGLAARAGTCVIMVGVTLTSILPMLLAPLVVARLIANRSKHTIALAACWAAGLTIQWTVQLSGTTAQRTGSFADPLWVIRQYVARVVPRAIFGEKALGGSGVNPDGLPSPLVISSVAAHEALIAGAWVIVAAAIVVGLTRITAPHWPLAVTAFLFSLLIFLGELAVNLPVVQPRYVIAPALLLYAGLVAVLRPRGPAAPGRLRWRRGVTWCPVAVFALLLTVVIGFNYRVTNGRTNGGAWSATLATAQRMCGTPEGRKYLEHHIHADEYLYHHMWWMIYIPCSKVSSR